ncbi:MAG: restriction endonuclease [Thiotrichaceae bacterium IS1]|nr:MAG: restriction endonuclease [Thiotrichaceae bacterium IS1]
MSKAIQKILFGSPGTGKSYRVDNEIIPNELGIDVTKTPENVIKTVFHPEYTYGDFMGKLVPITRAGKVEYSYYEGHFLKALARAYKNLIHSSESAESSDKNVVLVIDEINRGNSAAIFGNVFQLLDREKDGWSNYQVNISEMEFDKLINIIFGSEVNIAIGKMTRDETKGLSELETRKKATDKLVENTDVSFLKEQAIKIPPNLSIIATMNTSDSSIYYMDSAFKRRWDWEFIDVNGNPVKAEGIAFPNRAEWEKFVQKLNAFIKSNHKYIRGIEDKQVGHWFIKDEQIQKSTIQNKLMFFIWDNVFSRDKKPLIELMFGEASKHHDQLITFGDFAKNVDLFINKIQTRN